MHRDGVDVIVELGAVDCFGLGPDGQADNRAGVLAADVSQVACAVEAHVAFGYLFFHAARLDGLGEQGTAGQACQELGQPGQDEGKVGIQYSIIPGCAGAIIRGRCCTQGAITLRSDGIESRSRELSLMWVFTLFGIDPTLSARE